MRKFATRLAALAAALTLGFSNAPAQAQARYPNKPVTLVVAFTPGGPSDVLSRIMGKKLGEILGQTFIIENRPGGAGNIAAEQVARAPRDGYTLLMGNNSILATNASLFKKLNYDAEKDFAPISLIGTQASILVVNNNLPVKTLDELIALARKEKGKLNYGNSGFGAAAHLSAELFKSMAKVDLTAISYKGAAPALQDLIAGHVHLMFATAASVVGHVRENKVRPIAVTTLKRTAVMPDIPTIDELGIKGFDATTWHGLVATSGTPPEAIETLHKATVEALKDPQVRKQLGDLGVDIVGNSPSEFDAYIKAEIPKWTAVVKASGARIE